jgi:prolyl-tRNA editing enzyme YbaK/EbsC (Cys-tRNA(Pro) deacylase)
MSFCTPDGPILIVAAGDVKVDNRKFKDTFHTKAKMPSGDEVEQLIGHGIGGVCPFGVNDGVRVFLDESLRRFDIVYPAAGTSASAVKLTVLELEKASEAISWVDLTVPREPVSQ